jgi:hypothetical protein
MRLSKIGAVIAVPLLSCALLAGCGQFRVATPQGTATCTINGQGGACAVNGHTVSVEPGAGHASGPAATQPSPTPAVSTSTPATSPTPTFESSAVQAVQDCMSQFSTQARDTLVSFSTSADARQNMAICLQIPPQTTALFLKLLFRYAYQAYIHGDFDTPQGQSQFTSSEQGDTLPAAVVRCDRHYN